tara:strand:+ start:3614 stop:3775 length:162 start_codon:yes stop_codon:yes gene_type:complete
MKLNNGQMAIFYFCGGNITAVSNYLCAAMWPLFFNPSQRTDLKYKWQLTQKHA